MRQDSRVFILRHDVDSPFVYRKNLFKKIMNRVYLSKPKLPGKEHLPGYHEALRNTLELEEKYNAKGTFFFRTVTCPPPDLVKKIINDKHEIAYHADQIGTFQEFHDDLKKIREDTMYPIQGFTKHGIAKVRSGGPWDEKKMVEYAHLANLKYLAQGVFHPDWEKPQLVNGVFLFGHHLTIKDSKIDELIKYLDSHTLPMLLLHPEDLFIEGVKEKFIKILKFAKAISVEEALNQLT